MSTENEDSERAEREAFEAQVMAGLKPDPVEQADQQAGADAPGEQAAPQQNEPQASQPVAAAAPAAAPAAPAAQERPDNGNLRPALRAARADSRRWQNLARHQAQQIEDLKAGKKAPDDGIDTEALIKRYEVDLPDVGKAMRDQQAEIERLRQAQPAQPQSQEFVPDPLPPELQDLVDQTPELLAWHSSPEFNDRWQMAKVVDKFLGETHPVWSQKPAAERLKETVRRVQAEFSPTPNPQTAVQQALAQAKPRDPETLSDLRGGIPPNGNAPDYNRMSDEDVFASLQRFA